MNDPLLVRGFEGFCDLFRDGQRFVEWNRAARDPQRQILAFNEFHHERGDATAFLEAVDGRNV